jgi:hypothetical protein
MTPMGKPPPLAVRLAKALPFRRAPKGDGNFRTTNHYFAKQKIWRERILPEVGDKAAFIRGLVALAGHAVAAALLAAGRPKNAAIGAALGVLPAFVSNDLLAGIAGLDDWIDRMFEKPIERATGDGRKRADEDYGYIGQFFQYFIEGITHLLFAKEIAHKVTGDWGRIDRIPEESLATVFKDFFTQYYPHEHTDQPPYVWDASKRPKGSVTNLLFRDFGSL